MTDFNRLIDYAKEKHTGHPFAAFDHVERVHQICMELAKGLEVDEELLRTAAYLHDIAVPVLGAEKHNEKALEVAGDFLKEVGFPESKVDALYEAINTHTRYYNTVPKSIEAQILKDADGIDYIGVVGILRSVMRSSRSKKYDGNVSEHGVALLQSLIDSSKGTFSTEKGKMMAEERMNMVQKYIDRLQDEIQLKVE